jgi:hypothetical protein
MKIRGFEATVANTAFLNSVNSGVRSSGPIHIAPKQAHQPVI